MENKKTGNSTGDKILEEASGLFVGIFGLRAGIGYFFKKLEDCTPDDIHLCIKENRNLFNDKDINWQEWSKLARQAGFGRITMEQIIEEFRKHRIDLLQVILNHPDGMTWMIKQLATLKQKLNP